MNQLSPQPVHVPWVRPSMESLRHGLDLSCTVVQVTGSGPLLRKTRRPLTAGPSSKEILDIELSSHPATKQSSKILTTGVQWALNMARMQIALGWSHTNQHHHIQPSQEGGFTSLGMSHYALLKP